MVILNQKQKIITAYYREKRSQRRIAREVGINRRTDARYIKDYDKKRGELMIAEGDTQKEGLTAVIIEAPRYTTYSHKKVNLTKIF